MIHIIGDVGERKTGPRGLDINLYLYKIILNAIGYQNNVDYRYLPKNKGTDNIIQNLKY